jgi:hypothetical protein
MWSIAKSTIMTAALAAVAVAGNAGPAGSADRAASTPPPTVPACRAADLAAGPVQTGGAAGSAIHTVTVTNRTRETCALSGGTPTYLNKVHGRYFLIPVTGQPAAPDLVLQPGGRAQTSIKTINGYGGYDPSSPECAHPAEYGDILVQLPGSPLALPGLTLSVLCGDINVNYWTTATG